MQWDRNGVEPAASVDLWLGAGSCYLGCLPKELEPDFPQQDFWTIFGEGELADRLWFHDYLRIGNLTTPIRADGIKVKETK